jgi:hypothetical protein
MSPQRVIFAYNHADWYVRCLSPRRRGVLVLTADVEQLSPVEALPVSVKAPLTPARGSARPTPPPRGRDSERWQDAWFARDVGREAQAVTAPNVTKEGTMAKRYRSAITGPLRAAEHSQAQPQDHCLREHTLA